MNQKNGPNKVQRPHLDLLHESAKYTRTPTKGFQQHQKEQQADKNKRRKEQNSKKEKRQMKKVCKRILPFSSFLSTHM